MNIKNCPFCGDRAFLTSVSNTVLCDDDDLVYVYVECRGCNAKSAYLPAKRLGDRETDETLTSSAFATIALWNSRRRPGEE